MRAYRIESLAGHDRSAFASGSEALDRYFRERAGQDVRRRMASCFVAIDADLSIAGFYTLASSSVALSLLPSDMVQRLPRCSAVPTALLGRLAVATSHQGKGLGALLLADAITRAIRSELAAHAMVVDAKDAEAVSFYQKHGFRPFADDRLKLLRRLT